MWPLCKNVGLGFQASLFEFCSASGFGANKKTLGDEGLYDYEWQR